MAAAPNNNVNNDMVFHNAQQPIGANNGPGE
jgi:hypothetical protein